MIAAQDVATVAVVGTGAIGASWTTLALHHGLSVIAADPAPGAEQRLRDLVTSQLAVLGDGADALDRLSFTADAAVAAAGADLVLENGPERLDIKREIFAALDAAARPDVVLASSSSGLLPSSFQSACTHHPERVLVAHPFNPPHLVPLVEIVGGAATSAEAVAAISDLMTRLGKRPITVHREMPGHVANRLQAALWREAYWLVEQGVVSVADVDAAIAHGPGLRWGLLGPLATQHLSGGPGGLRHVLEHLGPPMVAWWDDLRQPEFTPELIDRLVEGVDEEFAGVDLAELTTRRDRALVEVLQVKDEHGLAATEVTS